MSFRPLFLAVSLAAAVSGCRTPEPSAAPEFSGNPENLKRALTLVNAMELLRKHYVDPDKVDDDRLFRDAMSGMASRLDPYSDYESPKEYGRQQIQRTGEFVGVGIEIVKPAQGIPAVTGVIPGSPAEKAGFQSGDLIREIDGTPTRGRNVSQCLKLIQGKRGTTVRFSLLRKGAALEKNVTRDVVIRPSVPAESSKLLPGGIGYIRLENFALHTPEEFSAALEKLRKQGAESLILDLRNNPGGLVEAAVKVASMLLPPETEVYRAVHRSDGKIRRTFTSAQSVSETALPLVVLVNPFSASSAEILTGALKDHKRAKVVGMRTFGKGTLLRVVPLPDGGALRYASGRYLTPSGRVIEKRGIMPDVEVKTSPDRIFKLGAQSRKYPGEVLPPGGLRDDQLARALELLNPPPEKKTEKAREEKPVAGKRDSNGD